MGKRGSESAALGFLTAVQHKQLGVFGGYLLLSKSGRPLEFHCTAPVKANRAQEILYGPTLQDYLFGELIGATLIEKGGLVPLVICTDRAAMLSVRALVEMPVVQVLKHGPAEEEEQASTSELVPANPPRGSSAIFQFGMNRLSVDPAHLADQQEILARLTGVADDADLSEPFTRIREAIKEAQQGKAA